MANYGLYRGTTPTVSITVDMDLTDCDAVWLTLEDEYGHQLTLEKSELAIDSGCVSAVLTQAQTLGLTAGKIRAQVRALKGALAYITDIMTDTMGNTLKEGEITADGS